MSTANVLQGTKKADAAKITRAEQYIECAIWGKNMKKMYGFGSEIIGDRLSLIRGKAHVEQRVR